MKIFGVLNDLLRGVHCPLLSTEILSDISFSRSSVLDYRYFTIIYIDYRRTFFRGDTKNNNKKDIVSHCGSTK